jgi:hypothetical protein
MVSHLTKMITVLVLTLAVVACMQQPSNSTQNGTKPVFTEKTVAPVKNTTTTTTVTPSTQQENFSAHLTFTEGERIALRTLATDPDNDDVELTFSKPFDNEGVWNTEIGDAGDYPVTVIAHDARGAETTQRILVTVLFANRPPTISGPDTITVKEGESIELDFTTSDPDEDEVILSYSGWMKGHTYTTTYADAGTHQVVVIAEDGQLATKKNVTVTVTNVNRAPVITTKADSYELVEGQTLSVNPQVEDLDGDDVTLTFGAPLDENGKWTPQLGDAGEHTIVLTATDGSDETTKEIAVNVLRANRAPNVETPSGDNKLYAKEGDLIDLRKMLIFSDEENENVTATYNGWMTTPTYQTTYEDAGDHLVTVQIEDQSGHIVREQITVIVADVNRPPVFVRPA